MLLLEDAVPVDVFTPMFDQVTGTIIATNVTEFLKNKPSQVPGISLFIWDEMVHRKMIAEKDKFKIAPIINNEYKGIYEFVKKPKKDPIADLYAVQYVNEIAPKEPFAEICLAQCYPSDIHIIDVEFSDNRKKIPAIDPSSKFRDYRGLHIFDQFLERLKDVGKHRGVERLSLMVAWPPLYKVFARHGFKVSETEMAQLAFKRVGQGFSMYLPLT